MINPKQIYRNDDIDRQDIIHDTNPKGHVYNFRLAPPSQYNDGGRSFSNTQFSSELQMGGADATGTSGIPPTNNPPFNTGTPIPGTPQPTPNPIPPSTQPSSSGTAPPTTTPSTGNGGVGNAVSQPGDKGGVGVPQPITGKGTDYSVLAQQTYVHGNVPGFTIDPQFTNKETTTYVAKDGQVVIAYSGTKLHQGLKTAFKDLWADLHINNATEEASSEFHRARELARGVIKKYGRSVVTATGHSLGGTKAIYVSSLFSIPAYVYDAAWSGQEATKASKTGIFDKTSYVWHLDKVMSFNAWGDPVSLLQGKAVPHKTIVTSASEELKQALWHAVGEGLTVSGVKDFVFNWAKSFMTSLVPGPGGGYQTIPTSDPDAERALEQSGITAAEDKAEQQVAEGGPEVVIMTALVAELAYLADMALRTHGIKEFRGFHTAVVA